MYTGSTDDGLTTGSSALTVVGTERCGGSMLRQYGKLCGFQKFVLSNDAVPSMMSAQSP